jgi:hypothetical protein
MNGYWVNGEDVIDVSMSTHIQYILDNLEKFGLDKEEVKKAYEQAGERYGTEGKTREMLIKYVATQGWIRVRHYIRPRDYWSIQCNNTNYQRNALKNFCRWAISHKLMSRNDEVTFLGYENPQDALNFSFFSGGVGNFLMESQNTK